MIITKEQQEVMVDNYLKTHTVAETKSFVDGMIAVLSLINRIIKQHKP
jgi:hypothetical protein